MNVETPRAAPPLPFRIDRKDMPNTIVMRDAKGAAVFGMMYPGSSEIKAIKYVEAACNVHYRMLEALKAAIADIEAGRPVNGTMMADAIAAAEAEAR